MEVRDGFIVGIFNYCDRWCERCAFTSRCRLFADHAETEASLDSNLKAIAEAPPLPEEVPPPASMWVQELIEDANETCKKPMSPDEWELICPRVPAEHQPIDARARAYALQTYQWLTASDRVSADAPDDAWDVISWFHFLIAAKINRALTIWPGESDDHTGLSDGDGSAKVALLGIARSHAAWLDLIERGVVPPCEADPFIADLVWLGEAVEGVRPNARAFVRPGLDEPEAVAKLLAAEGRQ